jgi:hypothetical protein
MNRISLICIAIAPLAAGAGDNKVIQDNSFLVEEAYNQEEGVVQHIGTFQRFRRSGEWAYTFTQEWPMGGLKHQFSYTVPVERPADSRSGLGDIALNYRYQLIGDGEAKLAVSPRFTVIAATGDEREGRGQGAPSYQVQLPVSTVIAPALVAHTNVGYTWTPRARDAEGNRADVGGVNLGQSLVWLAHDRLNFLLEAIYTRSREVVGAGRTASVTQEFVSPGVRWSYDFPSGLQIVPGIAFPIGIGPSRRDRSVFLYLSFEHPFGKGK